MEKDIDLIRDKNTGKSKGYAFLSYKKWESTVLAVDNFNGAKLLGRTIRVDHTRDYNPDEKEIEKIKELKKERKRKRKEEKSTTKEKKEKKKEKKEKKDKK